MGLIELRAFTQAPIPIQDDRMHYIQVFFCSPVSRIHSLNPCKGRENCRHKQKEDLHSSHWLPAHPQLSLIPIRMTCLNLMRGEHYNSLQNGKYTPSASILEITSFFWLLLPAINIWTQGRTLGTLLALSKRNVCGDNMKGIPGFLLAKAMTDRHRVGWFQFRKEPFCSVNLMPTLTSVHHYTSTPIQN